jgi:hypothetical protein
MRVGMSKEITSGTGGIAWLVKMLASVVLIIG